MGQRKKRQSSHFDEKICLNEGCLNKFKPKTYNGVYCSPECRKIATNKKLLDKYYVNKNNKNKKRVCATVHCSTVLSVYNKEKICEQCKIERYIKRLASWGWDESKLREEY